MKIRLLGVGLAFALILVVKSDATFAACQGKPVTVFSAYWCPFSSRVRGYLTAHNIPFRLIETTNN